MASKELINQALTVTADDVRRAGAGFGADEGGTASQILHYNYSTRLLERLQKRSWQFFFKGN